MPPKGGVLVYRPGALGDSLLLGPSLAALRGARPERPVRVICHPTAGPILLAAGLAEGFMERDDPRVDTLFAPPPVAARRAFGELQAAVAYVTAAPAALRGNLAALSAGRCVVAPSQPPPDAQTHVAQHLLDCLATLGVEGDALAWPGLGLPSPPTDRLVIQPGSGSAAKCWDLARFEVVGEALAQRAELAPTWLLGPAEEELRRRLASPGWDVVAEPAPLELAALLGGCRLYLGNDSGVSHLAGMVGAPTLALFGPTDPARWRPLGPRVRILKTDRLSELSIAEVLAAAEALLAAD
jgi:ADP-heptose:LPS heptosyltransferase